jgi:hypothetical protein
VRAGEESKEEFKEESEEDSEIEAEEGCKAKTAKMQKLHK